MLSQCAEAFPGLAVPHFDGPVGTASDTLVRRGKRDDIFDVVRVSFEFDRRNDLKLIIKCDNGSSLVPRGQEQSTIGCESNASDSMGMLLE